MAGRFIPDGDPEFRDMAQAFATNVARNRERLFVSELDAELLTRKVNAFCDALMASKNPATRGQHTNGVKKQRRLEAVQIIRRISAVIRASDRISTENKLLVGVKERSKKLTKGKCPIYPPLLWFEGAIGEGGKNTAIHQLRVEPGYDARGEQHREGAVRIELFYDLVAPGEPVPTFPGESMGGRPTYMTSFTKSPIRVAPPIPPTPMLVVYWVRWADSSCRVGPFSKTCQARWEGQRLGAQPTLGAMPEVRQLENDPKQITFITQFRERYIEGVRVEQRMLEDGRKEPKRLANSGEPSPCPLPEGEGSESHDAA
jgi:hypothetical protein